MKIKSSEYVKSYTSIKAFDLEHFPTIAFIGRSNVGKSTLINSLLNRKKLVKTSATPGKTQLINYFLINESFYFVDLPGYGFANVPVEIKKNWIVMIKDFLDRCPNLRLILQLVDVRHNPAADDLEFQALVQKLHTPNMVIANKIDKLKKSQIQKQLAQIRRKLSVGNLLTHSGPKKIGQLEIWEKLSEVLDDV